MPIKCDVVSFLCIFTLLLECTQPSDCANGGVNYACKSNECSCATGFLLTGDTCTEGMSTKIIFMQL